MYNGFWTLSDEVAFLALPEELLEAFSLFILARPDCIVNDEIDKLKLHSLQISKREQEQGNWEKKMHERHADNE